MNEDKSTWINDLLTKGQNLHPHQATVKSPAEYEKPKIAEQEKPEIQRADANKRS